MTNEAPRKIEQWAICIPPGVDRYTPPELVPRVLTGDVDGKPHTSDRIKKVDGSIVTTEAGVQYLLGEPDPHFVEYCRKVGCHIPTPECPIKTE